MGHLPTASTMAASNQLLHFDYVDRDCLYRDHEGIRVIADVEGFGKYQVDGAVEVTADGCEADNSGTFSQHLLVRCRSNESAGVKVLLGPEPSLGEPSQISGQHDSCGWVIESSDPFTFDELPEPIEGVSRGFPAPVLNAIELKSGQFCEAPYSCPLLLNLDVSDDDILKRQNWAVKNGSDKSTLDSQFLDGSQQVALHMSHLNTASFDLEVPRDCAGLIFEKTYDCFHGRQRARILLDGNFCTWWYAPYENRLKRWNKSRCGVDLEPADKARLMRVSIDPPAGVPLWDISSMKIFGLIADNS